MASQTYMQGRMVYSRPQAMLWSKNSGTLTDGIYVPDNAEFDSSYSGSGDEEFIILSDHNRTAIDVGINRIEQRDRMINGRMRSYHVADKLKISTSWTRLPSRAYPYNPAYNAQGQNTLATGVLPYTADGGAGGEEMLAWYENNTGPFWVFLAYDKYRDFGTDSSAYAHLNQYNQIVEMYLTDFSYSIEKRGGNNHDLWNISITLEEA